MFHLGLRDNRRPIVYKKRFMKKVYHYNFILLSVFLILFACDNSFEPSGSNFVVVEPPREPLTTIELSLQDTLGLIVVDDQMVISYNIDVGDLRLYEVHVYLDSALIHTGFDAQDEFYYDPNLYEDGLYLLRIEFATSSGSGSLGDTFGAEGFIVYHEWGLINVTNLAPLPIQISDIHPENGQLRITWESYPRLNFLKYEVKNRVESHRVNQSVGMIYSPMDTTYIDPYYVGGTIRYSVDIHTNSHVQAGIEYTFSSPQPNVSSIEKLSTSSTRVSWTKCNYPSNFGKYFLSVQNFNQAFTNINDTSAVITHLPFGNAVYGALSTYPRLYPMYPQYQTDVEMSVWAGDYLGVSADKVDYIPANDLVYLSRKFRIYLFDNSTMELQTSRVSEDLLGVDVSANGDYVVAHSDENVFILDPLTLETLQTIQLQAICGYEPSIQALSVSDTGVLFCAAFPSSNSDQREVLAIDLSGPTLLDRSGMNSPLFEPGEMSITANGEWLVHDYDTFRFDGQALSIYRNNVNAIYLTFLANGNQFVYRDPFNNTISVKNLSNLSVSMTKSIEGPMSASIDPVTGYFGIHAINNGLYKIFDLSTGALLNEFPVNIMWDDRIALFDNKVFSETGFIRQAFDQ